jgi:hypothetical protein
MEKLSLKAQNRAKDEKLAALRKGNFIPAVVY